MANLRKVRAAAVIGVAAVVFAGLYAVHSVIRGHGRLHNLARALYHQYKDEQQRKAYAAEEPAERADSPLTIYGDSLGSGWQDWSWATHDLKAEAPVHSGSSAIVMSPKNNEGVYLHHDSLDVTGYGSLQFFLHGNAKLNICTVGADLKFNSPVAPEKYDVGDVTGGWRHIRIPLDALGSPRYSQISGVVFQANGKEMQPPVVIDDISLLPDASLAPAPTTATVSIQIDPGSDRHPISPYVYGMAFAPPDYLQDLKISANRWGGNDKTRYNWVLGNADNAGRDWNFANRTADGNAPNGKPSSSADDFVRTNTLNGAETLLTIPTIGWVASDANNSTRSQGVPASGGDPLTDASGAIAGYDPAHNRQVTSLKSLPRKGAPFVDAPSPSSDTVYQDEWVNHLVKTFGNSNSGGVRFYAMDNEPDLWDTTHTDVHPARMGYDDILNTFESYATAVKAVDPTAQITGPVSWGWTGYQFSPLDRGGDNFHTHSDQDRHGGTWFLPWFLKSVHERDFKSGKRSLDVLDVHYYPQAQGVYGGQNDPATRARRLRETRSLWDPTYVDESWIGQPIQLIPRLQGWIDQNYPGTKIGITEWNFGADQDISGGLAVADVLGVFGKEHVYLANYWAYPSKNSPAYLAFKIFRNADGHGDGFGDTECNATSADASRVSCYASTDSITGTIAVVLINKMPKATVTAPITVTGLPSGRALAGYRLSAAVSNKIEILPSGTTTGSSLNETLPPYSVTMLRIAGGRGQ